MPGLMNPEPDGRPLRAALGVAGGRGVEPFAGLPTQEADSAARPCRGLPFSAVGRPAA